MSISKSSLVLLVLALTTGNLTIAPTPARAADFRPPAVPLVTLQSLPQHLVGSRPSERCDHKTLDAARPFARQPDPHRRQDLPADGRRTENRAAVARKESVEVLPTRSIYEFEEAGVHVTMTFMQPRCPTISTSIPGR